MRDVISFYTKQLLEASALEQFLADTIEGKIFQWLTNFHEYSMENELGKHITYISTERLTGNFPFYYSVLKDIDIDLSIRQCVDMLKILSQSLQVELLSSDDEVNPWSWIYIEPNGDASTIETKTDDELVIANAYNFPFGDFRMKEQLSEQQVGTLKQLALTWYPNIEVHHSDDGPVINGEFNKVKDSLTQLKGFDNHYELVPLGKTTWLSIEEKSKAFINLMNDFYKQTGIPVCVFPRNFSEVKTIEGGTDSQEYCLVITDKGQERIVYKERRKSWMK